MGDRTTATITITKEDYNNILRDYHGKDHDKFMNEYGLESFEDYGDTVVELIDYQANYGHIEKLESFLEDNQYEYDLRWENGGDYAAGELSCRRLDNKMITHEIYDEQAMVLNALQKLAAIEDGDDLRKEVANMILALEPYPPSNLVPKCNNTLKYIEEVLDKPEQE